MNHVGKESVRVILRCEAAGSKNRRRIRWNTLRIFRAENYADTLRSFVAVEWHYSDRLLGLFRRSKRGLSDGAHRQGNHGADIRDRRRQDECIGRVGQLSKLRIEPPQFRAIHSFCRPSKHDHGQRHRHRERAICPFTQGGGRTEKLLQ